MIWNDIIHVFLLNIRRKPMLSKALWVCLALLAAWSFPAAGFSTVVAVQCVENSKVCMVEDRVSGRENIPIEVGGKTYYGCCPVCVGKLKSKTATRFSKDPDTGKEVDKAKAYIVAGEDGTVIYFESGKTFRKYLSRQKR